MVNNKSIGNLIRVIDRYSQMFFMGGLTDFNLHGPGQIRIVLTLSKYKHGVTQDKLAKSLLVDKGSISRMIRPMIANGIVERQTNPEDRRANLLRLTDEVQSRIPEIRERARRWTDILSQGFSPEELEQLFLYLDKLKANAELYLKGESNE